MTRLKNKTILVTGADGFIGSHLVESLLDIGVKLKAFVYYNSFNSWGWLDTISAKKLKKIEIFTGDIRDSGGVRKAMQGIDIVFHLAALIGIPFSYHSPDTYVDTNIKGTLNVLQAARDAKVEKVIVTSTSEVYGTAKYVPIDEKHPLQGQSPYSATKIAADKIAESFYLSFNLPVVIARPFNTYGPRQSARAVIPTIIIQLLSGKNKIHLGSLTPMRDFNFVKDVCNGFIALAGPLAKMLINKINPRAKIVLDKKRFRPKESEVERLLGSNKKIKELTGWKPKYSLAKGLDETIAWFKDQGNLKLYKAGIYNV
jgi:NAD dependent epimerase/dehydratase